MGDCSAQAIFLPPKVRTAPQRIDLAASSLLRWHIWLHPLQQGTSLVSFISISLTIDWKRQWHPTPVLLPGQSHGWRSLVGYSPWGREESDMTERLHFHISLSCTGEGNGSPLQDSCLENPRDGSLLGCHLWGHTELDMTDVT